MYKLALEGRKHEVTVVNDGDACVGTYEASRHGAKALTTPQAFSARLEPSVTFEYEKQEYYDKYAEFIGEQVDKHYDLIKDAVAFLGWKAQGRSLSKNIRIYIDFDEMSTQDGEKWLAMEMTFSGEPVKIEFTVLDESDFPNHVVLGRLVFSELPSWSDEDDKKLLKRLKRLTRSKK